MGTADGPADSGRAAARRAARAARSGRRSATVRRLLPQTLVVTLLAGGVSAFVSLDKAVRLSVDGSSRTLRTFAGDVAGLLRQQGVDVGAHDLVTPAPGHLLTHGDRVLVRHARPFSLTLDGRRHRVWTTARTVNQALRRLGVRTEGAELSVAGSAAVPPGGLEVSVRTERTVTLLADGREHRVRTNAATVAEVLAEAGVELDGADTVSVPGDTFPHDGLTVSVVRITDRTKVREEHIRFATVRRTDPALRRGAEVVEQSGRHGLRRITYRLRTVDGVRQPPEEVSREVVRPSRPRIVRVGTGPPPESDGAAGAGLNWAALARCESGGRPDAVDPSGTYGGLYQLDTHTWHELGGSGRPQDAPATEQTRRARKLYAKRGTSPWPVCGRKLHE